jgi:tetratricopeptide (TPR) repeat protein
MTENDANDTVEALETAAAQHPADLDARLKLADSYAEHDQWSKAGQLYQGIIEQAPDKAAAYTGLGTVFENQAEFESAESYYRKAIELQPDNSEAYDNLAALLEGQHRNVEAYTAYQQVFRLSTDSDELQAAHARMDALQPRIRSAPPFSKVMLGRAQWSLVIGVISIIANGTLDPIWGIANIVVALLMWKVRIPATLVIFAVMMVWAALLNIVSSLLGAGFVWTVGGLIQIYWSYLLFKDYRRFRRLPAEEFLAINTNANSVTPDEQVRRITRRYALAGALLGVLALLAIPGIFGCAVVSGVLQLGLSTQILSKLFGSIPDFGGLALGLCIAAFLSTKADRPLAIGGMMASVLAVGAFAGVLIFLK